MPDINIMTEYRPMPTEEEYRRRKLPGKAPIYGLSVFKVGKKKRRRKINISVRSGFRRSARGRKPVLIFRNSRTCRRMR